MHAPRLLASIAAVTVAFMGEPIAAQAPPQTDDPEATVVQELVVVARLPGPAWWRISKGAGEVWIMGLPAGPIPKGLPFDHTRLREHLKGAALFLPAPQASVTLQLGVFQSMGMIVRMAPGMGWTNGDIEKAMPKELAARFEADRISFGEPLSRYASPVPMLAALKLRGDYLEKSGLTGAIPPEITDEARRAGVPVAPPLRLNAPPFNLHDVDLARPPIAECFTAVLAGTETDPAVFAASARGWSEGALRTALAAPRDPLSLCENRIYSGAFNRRMIAAEVDALAARLSTPQRTIAVLGLRTLLARDGVIVQLRARGFQVDGPEVIDEPALER